MTATLALTSRVVQSHLSDVLPNISCVK